MGRLSINEKNNPILTLFGGDNLCQVRVYPKQTPLKLHTLF
jgi:hypothetical protein